MYVNLTVDLSCVRCEAHLMGSLPQYKGTQILLNSLTHLYYVF